MIFKEYAYRYCENDGARPIGEFCPSDAYTYDTHTHRLPHFYRHTRNRKIAIVDRVNSPPNTGFGMRFRFEKKIRPVDSTA